MPIPRIEPIVIPAVPLPPPVTQGIPAGPTRGITVPRINEPALQYPTVDLPGFIPQGDGQQEGGSSGPGDDGGEDTRDMGTGTLPPLPDPNTIIELPPDPEPTFDIPLTEYALPVPDATVLSTTASAAFVATTSALAATTALKPVMDSLFKILKAVFKQALKKLMKKKDPDYSDVPTLEIDLSQLDRFRFDSSRPYQGPQYPRKAARKEKPDGKTPQPE